METAKLKKFAQYARRSLIEQVASKLNQALTEDSAARRENPRAVAEIEKQIFGSSGKYLPACPLIPAPCPLVERVAYIWFNRFCALRFMDVNRYNRVGIVSPADPGQFQPEILAEAKMGHIDEEMMHDKIRQQVFALLDGKAPSRDPQGEAYRLLVVAACNSWNKAMPFLFERIEDYTELLMPDDLLSGNSILSLTREAMTPDVCEDVEVIGWLYQFYISEKKDEVFDGLKKNKKITPENIPAATQLFTPHWIVRYLVENSLGRLWMLNRPNSPLKERMEYYIEPQEDLTAKNAKSAKEKQEDNFSDFSAFRGSKDFLVVNSPEEIKICDPACGSGHMLTYAFDLLYAIYEEEGYEPAEIPSMILTNNLYGIEIDERAGELAAFALTMKARAKQRRFFNKGVKPNICVLEKVDLTTEYTDDTEWKMVVDAMVKAGVDRDALIHDLGLFSEADNFGSLLRPRLNSEQAQKALDALMAYDKSVKTPTFGHYDLINQCQQALRQADYLSSKYHVVIMNPPYLGHLAFNPMVKNHAKVNFPKSKQDLYSMFIERSITLSITGGYCAPVTMNSWMFLVKYQDFRMQLLKVATINSMAHLGPRAFDSIGGEVVQTTAFVLHTKALPAFKGSYLRLVDGRSEAEKNDALLKREVIYRVSTQELEQVPGAPITYWISEHTRAAFASDKPLVAVAEIRQGMATTDNKRFLRSWSEISFNEISFGNADREQAAQTGKSWFPYNKGGEFRKWYGNNDHIVLWEKDGEVMFDLVREKYPRISDPEFVIKNPNTYFWESVTWSGISTSAFGARYSPPGFIYDVVGSSVFPHDKDCKTVLTLFCSKVATHFVQILNPTYHFQVGDVQRIPWEAESIQKFRYAAAGIATEAISLARADWDFYETSWDFTSQPLLNPDYHRPTLKTTYQKLRAHWLEMTLEMQRLEEENNRIFIDAYGLQDELTPEVPLNEITLTCNPYYRYNKKQTTENIQTTEHTEYTESEKHKDKYSVSSVVKKSFPIDDELEALLLADTMRELVSYAVGCMFGRYALDKPGLILANQGETIEDYYKTLLTAKNAKDAKEDQENNFSDFSAFRGSIAFHADEDNVIPMLDGDWFTDDISERFKQFLKVAFGAEHYEENLRFVENALGKDIRKYFLKDFYSDHVKRYKKRPIYWLFSSGSGKSGGNFNALIYMHRYRPDTVSVVLNDYLREFRTKLTTHKNHLEAVSISASAAQGEKTKALKEIEKINKMIVELEVYEREVLYPLATEQIEIDLDDGVKVNYPKFGAALKKIPGLDAKED